jgi:acetyl esterase/lipase
VSTDVFLSRPGLDPELEALLAGVPAPPPLTLETLPLIRPYSSTPLEPLLEGRELTHRELTVTSRDGTPLPVTVLSPEVATPAPAPCVLWLHGGGMVMGDRFSQLELPLEWADRFGATIVTVDYRLAPEVGGTTLVEDAYDALVWTAEHAEELGIDPDRLVVAGTSAGGGLAAGVTLMARDLGGPAIAAQLLIYPMLDHRNTSTSSHQYSGTGVWSREANDFAWSAVLAPLAGAEVPAYVSPSLATDLSGLPPTYVDAGTAEVFRDEDVDYASRIWAAGGQAELHVWAGGFHGFDAFFADAVVSRAARRARVDWLGRVLAAAESGAGVLR